MQNHCVYFQPKWILLNKAKEEEEEEEKQGEKVSYCALEGG